MMQGCHKEFYREVCAQLDGTGEYLKVTADKGTGMSPSAVKSYTEIMPLFNNVAGNR